MGKSKVEMLVAHEPLDMADAMVDALSDDEIFRVIKYIDEKCQNWDFTLRLHRHFAKLAAQYDGEVRRG